ncbi:right-handed parallel beta-helix repeat-containing protein [Bacillus sp. PAMC26568]|nr:right-handed parallel beta-helix repeat-containing protein [Bacillus sp. PAMC26568]
MGRFPKLLTGLFRDFRNSYNEGIEKAEIDLNKALGDSGNALTKANEAIEKADITQTQLDQVTGAGTIDPAVEQMKVDLEGTVHPSPDARLRTELEKRDALLAERAKDLEQRSINVRQPPFNAKGDGITDDSAAIQSALDFAKSQNIRHIFFPTADYLIATALTLGSNLKLHGAGKGKSILKIPAGATTSIIRTDENIGVLNYVEISELTLVGGANDSSIFVGDVGRPIVLKKVINVSIDNIEIRYWVSLGISVLDSENVTIRNCTTYKTARDAISVVGCKKVIINGNIIQYCGDDGIACHYRTGQTSIFQNEGSEMVVITDNHLLHSGGIAAVGGKNIIIANNTCDFVRGYGVQVGGSGDLAGGADLKDVKISNNILKNMMGIAGNSFIKILQDNGIIDKVTKEEDVTTGTSSRRIIVESNLMGNTEKVGSYATGFNQTGNITLHATYGIHIFGSHEDIAIIGNKFTRVDTVVFQERAATSEGVEYGFIRNTTVKSNETSRCKRFLDYSNQHPERTNFTQFVLIEDNLIDLDTYYEFARNADGSSNSGYVIVSEAGTGFLLRGNVLKNFGTLFFGVNDFFIRENNTVYYDTIGNKDWIPNDSKRIYSVTDFSAANYLKVTGSFNGSMSAPPTDKYWRVGMLIYNSAPTAGGYLGWVCTATGTPGTWKGFGAIQT